MRTLVPDAGTKGRDKYFHPTDNMGCNYLSMAVKPVSGTQVVIFSDDQ